jgi:hypothetical protein
MGEVGLVGYPAVLGTGHQILYHLSPGKGMGQTPGVEPCSWWMLSKYLFTNQWHPNIAVAPEYLGILLGEINLGIPSKDAEAH